MSTAGCSSRRPCAPATTRSERARPAAASRAGAKSDDISAHLQYKASIDYCNPAPLHRDAHTNGRFYIVLHMDTSWAMGHVRLEGTEDEIWSTADPTVKC